jgi:membrane associated rhomboid family serine protease
MGASPALQDRISDHPLKIALVVYAVICIPVYLWLHGPVGTAGTVDNSVAIGGLLMGSLLFVPIIRSKLVRTYGGGQAARLGFIEE